MNSNERVASSSDGFSTLTARQQVILTLVSQGLTNAEIGHELHMTKYTVAQHLREMFKRTGASNRTDLVFRAYRTGVLSDTALP